MLRSKQFAVTLVFLLILLLALSLHLLPRAVKLDYPVE